MNIKKFKKEFNEVKKLKIFEIPVFNRYTKEIEYAVFGISIEENKMIGKSNQIGIGNVEIEIDIDFNIDHHLAYLYDECLNSILLSEKYSLS